MASSPNQAHRDQLPSPEELSRLPKDGGPHFNRLVFEASPYLQQHAANPVDWFPWGEEALDKARREDKPIFLSIGYATCHWCHVMEHESFEDAEVAQLINERFVPIKVDREERPDIDHVYMTACQAATGSGGWPLTAFLDHDLNVFFVGTYFPKNGGYNRPGLMEFLPRIDQVWKTQRDELLTAAQRLTAHLQQLTVQRSGKSPNEDVLHQSFQALTSVHDTQFGGFGHAPKFPTPQNLVFLLRYWKRTGNKDALNMVEQTLTAMRRGGVYDQIGFGFHRYSTDRQWLLPHFEKMLYDQALMTIANIDAFLATGRDRYRRTVREILDYVERELTAPEGGFYSAEDADSEGVEGKFYVWTEAEFRQHLDRAQADLAIEVFQISQQGNFAEEATGFKTGHNIPFRSKDLESVAHRLDRNPMDLRDELELIRRRLFEVREQRVHPFKDDKILTDWNGLMMSAFSRAGCAFADAHYVTIARRAADFALSTLRHEDGRLLKRSRNGITGLPAHIDDYAFLIAGLLDVYQATFDVAYLEAAVSLTEYALRAFWDDEAGGFFQTADDGEPLILRSKEIYDGALPSGNSVLAMNLLRLNKMTGRPEFRERAQDIFRAFSSQIHRSPINHNQLLCALDFDLGPSTEIVIADKEDGSALTPLTQAIFSRYLPNAVVLLRRAGGDGRRLAQLAPFTQHQVTQDGQPTVYVCRDFSCQAPITDASELETALDNQP